jgi:hypothetical protein
MSPLRQFLNGYPAKLNPKLTLRCDYERGCWTQKGRKFSEPEVLESPPARKPEKGNPNMKNQGQIGRKGKAAASVALARQNLKGAQSKSTRARKATARFTSDL